MVCWRLGNGGGDCRCRCCDVDIVGLVVGLLVLLERLRRLELCLVRFLEVRRDVDLLQDLVVLIRDRARLERLRSWMLPWKLCVHLRRLLECPLGVVQV